MGKRFKNSNFQEFPRGCVHMFVQHEVQIRLDMIKKGTYMLEIMQGLII
jgi:hypothetical protein